MSKKEIIKTGSTIALEAMATAQKAIDAVIKIAVNGSEVEQRAILANPQMYRLEYSGTTAAHLVAENAHSEKLQNDMLNNYAIASLENRNGHTVICSIFRHPKSDVIKANAESMLSEKDKIHLGDRDIKIRSGRLDCIGLPPKVDLKV